MKVFTGNELREMVERSGVDAYGKRTCFSTVMEYLRGENDHKTCCLYGLRRTGKTVMMIQAVRELDCYGDIAYILCENDDTIADLRGIMEQHGQADFFFLDEATKLEGFIECCSFLADIHAFCGKKIVMAGTDSLGFSIASGRELFDRVHMIHTTYIPYREYARLLGGSIDEYIRYGGTLTDGKQIYQGDSLEEYTNEAIAHNITHSLKEWDVERRLGPLTAVYFRNELPTYINRVIEYHNRHFVAEIMNQPFKSHDLGSARNLANRRGLPIEPLKDNEITEHLKRELSLIEPLFKPADKAVMDEIKMYLEKLDVLYSIPETDEVIFTQPGMRYCQAEALCRSLLAAKSFQQYSVRERQEILEIVRTDVMGGMLEDIVYMDFVLRMPDSERYIIKKFRLSDDGEFDITVIDQKEWTADVFEVKHSNRPVPGQARHLLNKELCASFEKQTGAIIHEKYVVYHGETFEDKSGISYVNVEELLKRDELLDELLSENLVCRLQKESTVE